MEDNVYQKVGLKVMKALHLVKKESDSIIKNFKACNKKLYEDQFIQIDAAEVEFMTNQDSTQAWEKFNKA